MLNSYFTAVMAGLDPAIHEMIRVDTRVKPAHDAQPCLCRAYLK